MNEIIATQAVVGLLTISFHMLILMAWLWYAPRGQPRRQARQDQAVNERRQAGTSTD